MRIYKLLILTVLLAGSLSAQGERRSLEECLDMASSSNPLLLAGEKSVEKASSLTATAFDAPNTAVELSQDATDGGGMENGLKFSQEFEFPTLYVAKRKALKAEYSLSEAAFDVKKTEIYGEITSTYYSAVRAESRLKRIKSLLAEYEYFVDIARKRHLAGETSMLELLNAERMVDKATLDCRDAETEFRALSLRLRELTGSTEPILPSETVLPLLELRAKDEEINPENTVQGALLRAELLLTQKNVDVARQDFMPGFFVAATSQLLIKSFNPYNVERPRFQKGNFMGFQVGVTVPLFFGAKKARLSAAKRDVEIARYNMEAANDRLKREYAVALDEYETSRVNLAFYEEKGLKQAREMVRLSQVSYELGEIDYMEYIRNVETAAEIELEYIDIVDRCNQAVIKLNNLKGKI